MYVRTKNFGYLQFVNNRIETLRTLVATVWSAFYYKEMDVVLTPKAMKKFDFLTHPFRLCRMWRTDYYQIFRSPKSVFQFFIKSARLYIGRCKKHRAHGFSFPSMFAAQCCRQTISLQFLLKSSAPSRIVRAIAYESKIFEFLFFICINHRFLVLLSIYDMLPLFSAFLPCLQI